MSSSLTPELSSSNTALSFINIKDFLGATECHPEPWEKSLGMILSFIFIMYLSCVLARVTDMVKKHRHNTHTDLDIAVD